MLPQRRSTGSSERQIPQTESENASPSIIHNVFRQSANIRTSSTSGPRPKPLATPSKSIPPLRNLHPSAPASPPTPAPSPTPHQRAPSWQCTTADDEAAFVRETKAQFGLLDRAEQQRFLAELLNLCDTQQLSFVNDFVSPKLKRDPFKILPNELCLRILSFIDDPTTLSRAAQVSTRWYELLNDDITWKRLCDKHAYRGRSDGHWDEDATSPTSSSYSYTPRRSFLHTNQHSLSSSSITSLTATFPPAAEMVTRIRGQRSKAISYRSHFKKRYLVEAAWRKGGLVTSKYITTDQGVVTSLHLTPNHILVALDNAKIHVFGRDGEHQRILQGHVMGVWAMVPCEDTLVSGGCDRDVRVWDIETGTCMHKLRGHTSTVRCLKMVNNTTAISGSRDATLRIWDISTGVCKNVLVGHQASVRCLEIHGDLVVSGSYDTTAKIWSISEGRCLRTLTGHFSQIYAVAFDGKRIATGSLDTSVRIWDPNTGQCHAILQGHTSLVGQLQMRGNILVTGGSDGSIRVWSLKKMGAIHRLAAHDNSITSLQFADNRIVSGGSDGRVKIWDLKTGQLVRELGQPAEAVWRIAFEEERAVVLATRLGRTVMEVWSFSPPPEELASTNISESGCRLSEAGDDFSGSCSEHSEMQDLDMQDVFVDPT